MSMFEIVASYPSFFADIVHDSGGPIRGGQPRGVDFGSSCRADERGGAGRPCNCQTPEARHWEGARQGAQVFLWSLCQKYWLTLFFRESDASKKNEPVIDWLDANVGRVSSFFVWVVGGSWFSEYLFLLHYFWNFFIQAEVQTPEMIRLLTTVVAESVIDGIGKITRYWELYFFVIRWLHLIIWTGGPTNQCQLIEDKFILRSAVRFSLFMYSDLALNHWTSQAMHLNRGAVA